MLHYGITPADRAKTEVTMRFPVENYPNKVVFTKTYFAVTYVRYMSVTSVTHVSVTKLDL